MLMWFHLPSVSIPFKRHYEFLTGDLVLRKLYRYIANYCTFDPSGPVRSAQRLGLSLGLRGDHLTYGLRVLTARRSDNQLL